MDYRAVPSLPQMFFDQAGRLGDRPFLWRKRDGAFRPISWRAAADSTRRLARGLGSLSLSHSLADISHGQHVQMSLDLVVELQLRSSISEQSSKPRRQGAQIVDHLYF